MAAYLNVSNCIYCGSKNLTNAARFSTCNDCGSLISNEEGFKYDGGYHAYKQSWLRPKIYFLRIKALRCGLAEGLTIADIGCGAGHSLYWAKRKHCSTIGYDIPEAEQSVQNADKFYSDLGRLQTEQADKCDVVWCWHTIEHTEKPRELIDTAFKILKPQGKLFLEFPEASGLRKLYPENFLEYSCFPEHRGIPSKQAVAKIGTDVGFSSSMIGETPVEGSWLYLQLFPKTFAWRYEMVKP